MCIYKAREMGDLVETDADVEILLEWEEVVRARDGYREIIVSFN